MAELSARECANMIGVTKRTIQQQIQSGKISATRNDKGHYQIDSSEFFRVYPNAGKKEKSAQQEIERSLESVTAHLETLINENKFLKEQLGKSENREEKLIETVKATTLLLDNKTEQKRKRFLGLF
jgi:excisionase family DNA binding protein